LFSGYQPDYLSSIAKSDRLLATCIMLIWSAPWMQLLVVTMGAMAGLCFCTQATTPTDAHLPLRYGTPLGWVLLILFALLLLGLPLIAHHNLLLAAMAAFYRAGALVFGGGHVVLPLLKESVVDSGWIQSNDFLAGYGAAQAVPGPMFTLAAYLGASLPSSNGGAADPILGATLALLMIFLPGLLLISGALPLWHLVGKKSYAARIMAGINAAVVGLLCAAFYNPVWISSMNSFPDLAIAIIGFLFLQVWRVSALWVVAWCVAASIAAHELL
jgi:chromate transporter